jgi:hypothetical protein
MMCVQAAIMRTEMMFYFLFVYLTQRAYTHPKRALDAHVRV